MSRRPQKKALAERGRAAPAGYDSVLTEVVRLLEDSRRASARAVNAAMTATYWEVGRRIVEGEQAGGKRAGYGKELLKRLSSGKAEQAEKVVRDSYTMPPKEYETITKVQQRCLKRGLVVSKSEVVCPGFAALGTLPDRELFALIEGLVKVKTGRPPE